MNETITTTTPGGLSEEERARIIEEESLRESLRAEQRAKEKRDKEIESGTFIAVMLFIFLLAIGKFSC